MDSQNRFQTQNQSPFAHDRKWDYRDPNAPAMTAGKAANAFISRVFTVMSLGLAITGLASWLFATQYLGFDSATGIVTEAAAAFYSSIWSTVLMFAPLVFVLVLSFGIQKLSYPVATVVFITFASVMGLSLSSIFFVYGLGSIFQVFLMTSVTFGLMAFLGATTSIDLTKFGSILFFALIGLIVVSVVNYFLGSTMMEYIISGAGVLIFAGLTAYDTQRLLRIGAMVQMGSENANKMALMGALSLYLNFINMFLFLLRLFGGGRD